MDDNIILELVDKTSNIDGKLDRLICEVTKITKKIDDHDEDIDEHAKILARHSTYFKIIGTIAFIVFSACMTYLFAVHKVLGGG